MAFDEVQFPVIVSRGSTFGPGFSTAITELPQSGAEHRVARWSGSRRRGNAGLAVRSKADAALVIDFIHARNGAARGFRWKDWSDYSTASDHRSTPAFDNETIGTGDGVTTTFQLAKTYTSGVRTVSRLIEKPVSGTVVVGVNGVQQMSGWTVNTTTGIITFTSAPAAGQDVTAGCEFDVPVRFGTDVDAWLQINIENFEQNSMTLSVVEEINPSATDDEFFYGGGTNFDPLTDDMTLSVLDGRTIVFNPDASGHQVQLPDPAALSAGGPYFYLINVSPTDSVTINDETATLIATLAASSSMTLIVGVDAMSTNTWYAV